VIIKNIFGSVVKFAQQRITEYRGLGLSSNMTFLNLDAHSNIHELQLVDYLGINGLSVTVEDKIHTINLGFTVTLAEDANLLRHMEVMARMYEELQPEKKLVYYDAETAEALSWMGITDGTYLTPMSRDELRAFQMISVTMLLNPNSGS